MQITESIRTSFEEVKGHPLRSFFTLIGVILGTLAIVVVMSVLDGVERGVWQGVEDLGMDGVLVLSQRKPSDPMERAKAHLSHGLRIEDQKYFEGSTLISSIGPVGETRAVVTAGKVTRRVDVYGITPAFVSIKNRKTSDGRFFGESDIESKKPVCILGFKLKEQLFGGDKAVGQQVSVGGRRLTVVGVGTKFNMEFVNDDDMRKETGGVYIPFTVYQDMFGRANAIAYLLAKTDDPEKSIDAEDEAAGIVAHAHNNIHDVRVENVGKEILKERGNIVTILRNWRIVFFSIAGISLLIGGVGIFSVLKISIGERLFEIGLRKAIGAGDGEIFMQFLIEAVTLSVVGATIGVALGIVVVKLISSFFPAGLPVSLFGLSVASGFAVSMGLLAGLYPSISASRMQPVEALRA
ncbi:MAG: putative transport system permease protein [Thermoanaerobaculia bacterium]|jgi:putative ABC transport system permease protein|nr:putative transport system permease protein [Thermoanaerobaculia bacterium]